MEATGRQWTPVMQLYGTPHAVLYVTPEAIKGASNSLLANQEVALISVWHRDQSLCARYLVTQGQVLMPPGFCDNTDSRHTNNDHQQGPPTKGHLRQGL